MEARSLINSKLKNFRNPQYLEIGVRNGETFFSIQTRNKYGVDPDFFFSKRSLIKSCLATYNCGFKMY
jgi:hypothetical protein